MDEQGNDLETTVRVDGRDVGEAGVTLKVPVCSKEVSVKLGSREWMEELKLEEGKTTTLNARPGSGKSAGMVAIAGGGSVRPFKLDVTEVTVAAYAACVKSGKCTEPSMGDNCNWRVVGKEQHPINCVDWMQADAYCKAQGKRLPDQAEWQFAASNGGRTQFPWGDTSPVKSGSLDGDVDVGAVADILAALGNDRTIAAARRGLASSDTSDTRTVQSDSSVVARARWNSSDGTAPVGSLPVGATQSGIQDLAGNVWEWMANDYEGGKEIRGSSWRMKLPRLLLASTRVTGIKPTGRVDDIGFRCAQ